MAPPSDPGGRLAVLWHLHQPDYRDPTTGRPVMPWVRLHALRGYRDLLVETAERAIPWTLNLVPSLLDQLDGYSAGATDDHLDDTRAPADSVDSGRILALPSGHPAMTEARPGYAALRSRIARGERLGVGDLRDVQVWATLAWFGGTALRDHPELRALVAKGSGFGEDDKAVMLAAHDAILAEIPALVRRLGDVQGPSVSASPYYHPILPLLVDARTARRAMPQLPDDVAFAYPEDALRQLVSARSRVAAAVGRPPTGLWPSEGAVSPEVVELAGIAKYRWLATDAGILANSDVTRAFVEGPHRPGGFDLGYGVIGLFRDTELSDRIGFRYARRDPVDAARELLGEAAARAHGGTIVVALDGENPWESFADAGTAFRAALVEAAGRGHGPRLVSLDAAAEEEPVGRVHRLHSGSWIGGDFAIWAGHAEDRAAWRLLAAARQAADDAPADRREAAMAHLLAAEGSDWFWWYGEEFETPWAHVFDASFRAHVAAAWVALGREPPAALSEPVRGPRTPARTEPVGFLTVAADAPGAWAAWAGAGAVRARQGSMADASGVRGARFGWTRAASGGVGALWVRAHAPLNHRFDPRPDALFPVADGFVGRYDAGRVRLRIVDEHGAGWPDLPLELAPPADAALTWWTV